MVNAERHVCLAVREYVYAWEMASIMVYIKDHMDNIYSEIDMVSRYINLNVNCFYKQVDTATTDVANMWDTAWFLARLDRFFVVGNIADTEKRTYDGPVVDGYEFGHGMVSQNKCQCFPVHRPNVGKCLARNKKL